MTHENLAQEMSDALGISHPSLATIVEMDPPLAREFTTMAQAVRAANVITAKEQSLIMIALNAAVVHLNGDLLRAYIAAALAQGASAGEIREVLQLT